ncbi:MAG: homocysteine S-methyltransferase family protein [bacterium]|jgi:methionine synthase I (cobalamin-dependent)|nr:homocysteine S-methyltransferase family protein [bacterium]
MNSLIQHLLESGPITTDGAWGTQLQALGMPIGECPDAWNLTEPDRVEMVARSYVQAGSQIILTNTFGASRVRLAEFGLADQVAEINRAGAEISRRAAGDLAQVFASIGPTGKMLMMGQVTEDELRAAFAEQAQALAEGGSQGLVIETMSDPAEAKIAVAAAKTTGLPVVGCMTFDTGKEKDRTMMGTTPEQAADALAQAGADVIGTNCGQGVEGFVRICQRLRAQTGLPLWIKANAGLPEMKDGKIVYNTTPDQFATFVQALLDAGANFIGGCCGTSPAFIQAIREKIQALTGKN